MAPKRRSGDHGATLIEFAVVFPLVILIVIGVAEFGLAFKDLLTVNHASREGARAGATAANDVTADIQILDAIADALGPSGVGALDHIRISDPDHPGLTTTYVYTGDEICAWTPCPDPFAGAVDFGAPYSPPNYLPSSRDVSAPLPGRVEVEITYTHGWVTNMIHSTSTWTTTSIMRLEPRIFQ